MTSLMKKIIYLLLGTAAGATVWFLTELQLSSPGGSFYLRLLFLGATIGAVYGAFLGCGEGIAVSIRAKILRGALIGFFLGIVGGIVSIYIAQGLLLLLSDDGSVSVSRLTGRILPFARIAGWAIIGAVIGSVEGLRSLSIRRTLFGIAGGTLGGLLGGGLYELLHQLAVAPPVRRLFGFIGLGAVLGAGLSLADALGRYATIQVMNGAFKGKEYIVNRRSTLIGSAPRCDILLPADSAVEGVHARIRYTRSEIVVERASTTQPLYVNDNREKQHQLKYGDVLRCGSTVLRFNP